MSVRRPVDGLASVRSGTLRRCCWRHALAIALVFACVPLASPRTLTGQSGSFPVEDVSAGASVPLPQAAEGRTGTAQSAAISEAASDPLPTPSHRRAYWHLFIAFGLAWALMFGYVVFLDRRIRDARRDLDRMEGR